MKPIFRWGKIFLWLFLVHTAAFNTKAQRREAGPTPKSIIKFNPVAAVDPFTFSTLSLSYEKRVNKIISLATEFGYQLYQIRESRIDTSGRIYNSGFTTNSDTSFVSPKGFKFSIEGRYYFLRPRIKRRLSVSGYAGINLFYRQNRTDLAIYYLKDSIQPAIDCYWFKRKNYGVLNIAGMQFITKKIAVDLYAGIGIMERKVFDYKREYNKDTDELRINRHGFGYEKKFFSENNEAVIGFSAGLRIGYIIR